MTEFPDKYTYKTTITNKLREDIAKFSKGFPKGIYLEIGFDKGYTMATVAHCFNHLYGVDIDQDRFNKAKELFSKKDIKNTTLLVGDSTRIPMNKYDVVLIDANHTYENVLRDTINVLSKNLNENPFIVIYHDFGLVNAGVKKFCDKYFSDFMVPVGVLEGNWNPVGGAVNGPEAVACAFNNEMKKNFLDRIKNEG